MRRLPRGATLRPPLERPGNGFGRALRPGPSSAVRVGAREAAPCLDLLVAELAPARERHVGTR